MNRKERTLVNRNRECCNNWYLLHKIETLEAFEIFTGIAYVNNLCCQGNLPIHITLPRNGCGNIRVGVAIFEWVWQY